MAFINDLIGAIKQGWQAWKHLRQARARRASTNDPFNSHE
jgi:hypothetical protein